MSCPDLLGRKLRCVILRSATLREENRVSLGLPGQVQHTPGLESAICNLRSAILREENRVSLGLPGQVQHMPVASSLQFAIATCGLRLVHSSCLVPSLQSATCDLRLATGPQFMPGLESAICNLRCATCDWPTVHAWPRVCNLQLAMCGLRLAHGSCLASSLQPATCDVRLATGPQLADRGLRIAGCGFACRMVCESAARDLDRTVRTASCELQPARALRCDGPWT